MPARARFSRTRPAPYATVRPVLASLMSAGILPPLRLPPGCAIVYDTVADRLVVGFP